MSEPKFTPKPPPTDPAEIHFKNAWQHRKARRYQEAAEEFLESLKHNPDHGATHFNLGWVYDRLNEGRLALTHVQQSIERFRAENQESNLASARGLLKKLKKKYPDSDPQE